MKSLGNVLKTMNYRGHISVRRKLFNNVVYIGGGDAKSVTERFGGYEVESMEVMDMILVEGVKNSVSMGF